MIYLLLFITSFILTVFATPFVINTLIRKNIMDVPDARKIHTQKTPSMGGIIIFSIVSILVFNFYPDINSLRFFFLASVVLIICGILDDVLDIRWYIKFILQLIAAILLTLHFSLYNNDLFFFGFRFSPLLGIPLFLLFTVGLLNAINLMDGLDGLVSGYSLITSVVFLIIANLNHDILVLVLGSALIGSLLGFLKYNAFPAKIFLGDSGSLILGFYLVVLAVQTSYNWNLNLNLDLTFLTMIFSVPIVDTLKVMIVRILNRKNPFHADKNHLHHVMLDAGVRHKSTVFIIQLISLIFIVLALLHLKYRSPYIPLIFFAIVLALLSSKYLLLSIKKLSFLRTLFLNRMSESTSLLLQANGKILFLSLVSVLLLLAASFTIAGRLHTNYFVLLFPATVFLTILSYIHIKMTGVISTIYFFINCIIFFSLVNYNISKIDNHVIAQISFYAINTGFVVVTATIFIFVILREQLLSKEEMFLSGFDLFVIVFITLLYMMIGFFKHPLIVISAKSILFAFVYHIWYKIYVKINGRYEKYIYYGSFAVTFALLFLMYYQFVS